MLDSSLRPWPEPAEPKAKKYITEGKMGLRVRIPIGKKDPTGRPFIYTRGEKCKSRVSTHDRGLQFPRGAATGVGQDGTGKLFRG